MDKYLLEILKEVNTIIIPGLGALTITNSKTGEVMFMPYLKHDDGNLGKFIAEKEGIDLNDAKNIIARYVREIESKLNVGDTYDMFRFGSFSKNGDGDIEFHSWHEQKHNDAKVKLDEQAPKSIEEGPIEEVSDDVPLQQKATKQENLAEQNEIITANEVSKPEIHAQKEAETTSFSEENLMRSEPEKIKEEDKASPKEVEVLLSEEPTVIEIPPMATTISDREPSEKESSEKTPIVPPVEVRTKDEPLKDEPAKKEAKEDKSVDNKQDITPSSQTSVESTTKKRGMFFYAMVAGFVLIIGSALTIALFYNSLEPYLPFVGKSEADTSVVETKQEDQAIETTDQEGTEKESTSEPYENFSSTQEETTGTNQRGTNYPNKDASKPKNSGNATGNYYLIVGSFRVKGNAERFSSGIPNSSVIDCNKAFYVVLGGYETAADAKARLKDVSGNLNPWVFQIPC